MQVLRAVVTSGSITAAAANLGYTPSAISQQIAALERETRIPLLERVGRGIRPTAAGRLLTEHAGVIIDKLVTAEQELADLRAGHTGRLRVGYFATAGAALVPPAVARFRAEYPKVQLELLLTEPVDPINELLAGRVDVAITVDGQGHQASPTSLVHLLDDPYRVVLPRGHELARKRVLDLADLADQQWVDTEIVDCPCRQLIIDACAAAGFNPNFAVRCGDYPTAQGFVAAGLGIAPVPQLGLGAPHPGVVVRRLRRPEPVRTIHAATLEDTATSPAVAALVAGLREAAAAH
ncbi:DNA-binding transcriptional regulator, LysR family [Goodfellowiella coeruleoviolacea]|uniref:DNA-binding transcriptional regulator, LysR family n=2 Tax=Goodfellowiella coeruleoviolacea TaxID=334858 RepID=A0AAE3GCG7_9PSEU|nr:DNA-binding transcriptional regulator, LysR family [Goodfellowiella coeruleoviolacea]